MVVVVDDDYSIGSGDSECEMLQKNQMVIEREEVGLLLHSPLLMHHRKLCGL